jgi:hypothetical protein
MFCPQCGSAQSDELKFCKSCGANLQAVRLVVAASPDAGEKFDWSKTWVAEMFLSEAERKRRNEELERARGITPEVKRYGEIKAGVITSCVGVALMIFLYNLMEGIILGGKVPFDTAQILNAIWLAGVIPFFVGLALIINGLFVSKRQAEALRRSMLADARTPDNGATTNSLDDAAARPRAIRPADAAADFIPPDFSVTDSTTRHLNAPAAKTRDTDDA